MRTYSASLPQHRQVQLTTGGQFIPAMAATGREILALLSAVSAAAAIVLLSVWVAETEMTYLLGAGIWGVGLVFLGLAVDSVEPKAFWRLVTGVILLGLAWLQANVSADYIIVSGLLVAAWVASGLFKRLR